jgi:hypothetical protein
VLGQKNINETFEILRITSTKHDSKINYFMGFGTGFASTTPTSDAKTMPGE